MLVPLAHFVHRRRALVVATWIVLTAFGVFATMRVADRWYESFSIPGVVWAYFIRISTNRRIFMVPTPLAEAFAFLRAMRQQPHHVALEPDDHHLELFEHLCLDTESAGDLAIDAYLAAFAIGHGSALASLDRDFARFPSLVWIRPGE